LWNSTTRAGGTFPVTVRCGHILGIFNGSQPGAIADLFRDMFLDGIRA
jgi:hypothetical protein